MARGPLPAADARRRNAPTIPTTSLPADGRKGAAPECPYALGDAGSSWWRWAWGTPQAAAWDDGALYNVARRARLEDDMAALEFGDSLDLADLLGGAEPEAVRRVEDALSMLRRSATGEVALMKEMRELDGKLGLNPKALADLRWKIVKAEKSDDAPQTDASQTAATVHRLRAVDPSAA